VHSQLAGRHGHCDIGAREPAARPAKTRLALNGGTVMATSTTLWGQRWQHVTVRHVPLLRSITWLKLGWDDVRHVGGASIGHGALIAMLGAVLLAFGSSHPYLIVAAVSGYLLIGPIMATGLCELSRRRMTGEPIGFNESIEPLRRSPHALLQFGAMLAVIAVVWFVASEVMLRSILHTSGPSLDVALWGGIATAENRPEIIGYLASGAVLAVLVFMLSVVAVPMMIDRNASAADAMLTSVRATVRNIPAMLVWSALIVILSAIGFVTMLLGMIIIAPVLGHATWHAYRDLIE
jgi:uncharacterized membrane protein